jgi:hypothetical protein
MSLKGPEKPKGISSENDPSPIEKIPKNASTGTEIVAHIHVHRPIWPDNSHSRLIYTHTPMTQQTSPVV